MNLLTATLRRRARRRLAVTLLRNVGAALLGYSIIAATILLIGRTIAEQNFATVIARSTLVLRDLSGASREAQAANEMLLAFEQIRRTFTPWTIALTAIAERAPTGITFTNIAVEAAGDAVRIGGRAATRDDLLKFQTDLRKITFLTEVTIPFSSFLQRERIDFSIDVRLDRAAVPSRNNADL